MSSCPTNPISISGARNAAIRVYPNGKVKYSLVMANISLTSCPNAGETIKVALTPTTSYPASLGDIWKTSTPTLSFTRSNWNKAQMVFFSLKSGLTNAQTRLNSTKYYTIQLTASASTGTPTPSRCFSKSYSSVTTINSTVTTVVTTAAMCLWSYPQGLGCWYTDAFTYNT